MIQRKRIKLATKETPPRKHKESLVNGNANLHDTRRAIGEHPNIFNEVADDAIIQLDLNGTIRSWNKGAARIKGYMVKEIIGRNYRIFYSAEDRAEKLSERLLANAKRNGRTAYEGWRIRKDGTRFWGSMTLTALHDAEGNVKGFLKITRDLTDKKIAEDNYANLVEALKQKNEELRKSEERYHKMVSEIVDYAIIFLDRDGKILDWNRGAEKLKGYTAREIIGKNFRVFYPKKEKEAGLPQKLLALAEKKGSVTHEGWRLRKSGERFWGNIVITTLHDEDGSVMGFSKVTRDLTDKKLAEDRLSNLVEELRQSNDELKRGEERYHRMVAEIQDYAIILLDEQGRIENWNTGAEFIKGYKPKEIIGKNFKIFYPREDQKNGLPDSLLEEAREKGKVTHEGWRVRKDGTRFWGYVVITALHNDEKEVIGFSKITRDLTERKLAEESLQLNALQLDQKNQTLERLNDELSSFTYIASHDLKEPLRKIRTFASRIRDVKFTPERTEEFLAKIEQSAIRMQNLIENLLSYSQVSNDESCVEKVDLNEIVASVKSDLEVLIQEKGAAIQSNNLPTIPGINYQFHQVFFNLISNALKFSKEHTAPKIKVNARIIKATQLPPGHEVTSGWKKYYHITIRDNGIGFDPKEGEKIFQAFHRLHSKGPIGGTGIGLAIVKKVIDNHQGIISAEGKPGEGARFNIYLPIETNAISGKNSD